MTAADPTFLQNVVDDLAPLGNIRSRPYFGGVALIHDDQQFAFVMGSALYFAVDDTTRPARQADGAHPFEYRTRTGIRTVEAYYDTPTDRRVGRKDRPTEATLARFCQPWSIYLGTGQQ